jgi:hypothetical protein
MAVQQVEELGLEGRPGPIRIEIAEEGVLGAFEQCGGFESGGEALGQPGLARPDRPVDREIAEGHAGRVYQRVSSGRTARAAWYGEGRSGDTLPVHIERLDVRLLRLPLAHFFETSFGRSYDRTFLLIRLEGEGHAGWGECVAEAHPYYSSETTETTWHIITSFLAQRVVGKTFEHPRLVFPALARVRGHNMAKAAVEMAAWDLYARIENKPLSAVLGGTRDRIASGVSIGIQDSLDELVAKVEKELAAGYRRIKIKIKPGWDLNAVEAVRARFPDILLMVDANAAYSVGESPRKGY